MSKSKTTFVQNHSSESIYKYYYQFKGRIILAGLLGAACVSEYSPGQELLFNKKEIPTFYDKEECVEILKKLLADQKLLDEYTKNFNEKVNNLWDDINNFKPIVEAIDKKINRRVKLLKFPYWYLRIAAKQIILRNIKLSSLMKTVFQFKSVFSIIKDSNIFIKFLIVIESIINAFWYSFILTLKPKK